ncbi:magnesium and cobalt transport protein CorA [Ornithinicoccus halotolerans]|uniref:magnesium and cobalt transport protein CorA n=1 Tax=Ornithinicoccus halotolerans TaxID=1748220 RepID=UPI0012974E82|nr:magnesium and cobalt transport protein CorA [Ornithinicoccus halotolerans]
MIVDQALYRHGRRQPAPDDNDALPALASADSQAFVWIGLKDPTGEEMTTISSTLDLPSLAVEDTLHGRQRVKIEQYGDVTFAALRTLRYVEATSDIETGEVMVFAGPRYVLTVRRGDLAPLTGVRRRLDQDPELLARGGPLAVLHTVIDTIVDTYLDIDDEVQQDLEEIEADVFAGANAVHSGTIYRLKREVLEFRRAAEPLVSSVGWLIGSRGPVASEELRLQFRDVTDHLQRIVDHIESYDRLLTDVLSAHLAQVSVQQNNDMRKISAWVAIAAVPTLLAGIFGMNFTHMPGLEWTYGYPVALAVMATLCFVLYRLFRRSGWL